MESRTASTAVVLEDLEPGAFDPVAYHTKISLGLQQFLTVAKLDLDIDWQHLRLVGTGTIMRLLARHVPALQDLSPEIDAWFHANCTKSPLPLHPTKVLPMGTSGIDELTVSGGDAVLDDLTTQMKMDLSWFNKLLILVCGDQLTVDRLRKAIRYKMKDANSFQRRCWVVPTIQPRHMKFALLKMIYCTHWNTETGLDVIVGLRNSFEARDISFNPAVADFYPGHNGLKVAFEVLALSATL